MASYNLKQIQEISSKGFEFEIPEETYNLLNYLCLQVGSLQLTTRQFKHKVSTNTNTNTNTFEDTSFDKNKKRRGNRYAEQMPDIKFQTTKLEQKTGFEADLDQIRLLLNKLTDKTFLDIKDKIIDRITNICSHNDEAVDLNKLGTIIYDICTTNKFYSKIFADLFAELATSFTWIYTVFNSKFSMLLEQYNNIKYVDSNKDYDGFCEMNKINERRRSVTTFYLNLALNGFIEKENIIRLLKDILVMIMNMIDSQNYKNEVDELTENVNILFNREVINNIPDTTEYNVNDDTIIDTVKKLAESKTKDHLGLSSKSIFKYMDLVDTELQT